MKQRAQISRFHDLHRRMCQDSNWISKYKQYFIYYLLIYLAISPLPMNHQSTYADLEAKISKGCNFRKIDLMAIAGGFWSMIKLIYMVRWSKNLYTITHHLDQPIAWGDYFYFSFKKVSSMFSMVNTYYYLMEMVLIVMK